MRSNKELCEIQSKQKIERRPGSFQKYKRKGMMLSIKNEKRWVSEGVDGTWVEKYDHRRDVCLEYTRKEVVPVPSPIDLEVPEIEGEGASNGKAGEDGGDGEKAVNGGDQDKTGDGKIVEEGKDSGVPFPQLVQPPPPPPPPPTPKVPKDLRYEEVTKKTHSQYSQNDFKEYLAKAKKNLQTKQPFHLFITHLDLTYPIRRFYKEIIY